MLMTIFTGHLDDANDKMSAVGIGISWVGILSSVIWGLNMGFQTISFRCLGLKEIKKLRRYLVRQFKVIVCFSMGFILIIGVLYWVSDAQYADKPNLSRHLRTFFLIATPAMILIFFSDVIRQFHFSFNCYVTACVIELCNVGLTALFCWLFSQVWDLGYEGVLLALVTSQAVIFLIYFASYLFNPGFEVDGKRFIS